MAGNQNLKKIAMVCIETFRGENFTTSQLSKSLKTKFGIAIQTNTLSTRLATWIKSGDVARVETGRKWPAVYNIPKNVPKQPEINGECTKKEPMPLPPPGTKIFLDDNTEISYEALGRSVHAHMVDLQRKINSLEKRNLELKTSLHETIGEVRALNIDKKKLNRRIIQLNESRLNSKDGGFIKLGDVARFSKR